MPPARPALEPQPAVTYLLEQFATHQLVALGELHGSQDEADFFTALLHHPAFPTSVTVIVVEFGNARYQAVLDRFIAGELVAASDLRPIWRDFIGSPLGFNAPIYEQFFRTVRGINRTLPPAQRLRVLLGDPPADWSQITQEAEAIAWLMQRDAHYTEIVATHVLAPGHRGLLIAGGMHFVRDWPMSFPTGADEGNIVQRLERQSGARVHVSLPHLGLGSETHAVEAALPSWPLPSIVSLHNTWLGEINAAVLVESIRFIPHPDSPPPPPIRQDVTLSALADSYLYLGPKHSLMRSTTNAAIFNGDQAYLNELKRRLSIIGRGMPFTIDEMIAEGGPALFPD